MKNKVLKATLLMALSAMILSGCGAAKEPTTDTISEAVEEPSHEETASDDEQYSKPVTIITHAVSAKRDGHEYANGVYSELVLSNELKEKYPKLAAYIDTQNEYSKKAVPNEVSEYAGWAVENTWDENPVYCSESRAWVERIDDKLFTLGTSFYAETGGAHPSHYVSTENVDPSTGEVVRLDAVLNDASILSPAIKEMLEKNYPGVMEEVDSFYFPAEGDDPDQFVDKLNKDNYTWYIDDKGLNIMFSPYEIASYATSYLEVLLSAADYPDLVKAEYIASEPFDKETMTEETEGDAIEVEVTPYEEPYDNMADLISNPTWKKYVSDKAKSPAAKHISLTKTVEDKTDWLSTEVWANKNGFDLAVFPYNDGNYYYGGSYSLEYDYMYNEILVCTPDNSEILYDFNLISICNGPDEEENRESTATEYINWAEVYDGILYVSTVHAGYASENSWSNYIIAIDLDSKELLWRSAPLTNNCANFKIVDDTIICGYGFTSEPDYIYLLDRFTGDEVDKIKINSAPYQFEVVDDTLYVATYNTAYEFKINR